MNKEKFLNEVTDNIERHEFHITTVIGGQEPRYSYSIGLSEKIGYEFIFAGGIFYLKESFYDIFSECILIKQKSENNGLYIEDANFILKEVDISWAKIMALGAFDYYGKDDINFLQIIPKNQVTKDIPDLSKKFISKEEKIWRWLDDEWPFKVSSSSTVITNLDVLKGNEPVREIMRWEEDQWEMFSSDGSEFDKNEIRVVSLGLLIGLDEKILPALELEIGKGIWREDQFSQWQKWN